MYEGLRIIRKLRRTGCAHFCCSCRRHAGSMHLKANDRNANKLEQLENTHIYSGSAAIQYFVGSVASTSHIAVIITISTCQSCIYYITAPVTSWVITVRVQQVRQTAANLRQVLSVLKISILSPYSPKCKILRPKFCIFGRFAEKKNLRTGQNWGDNCAAVPPPPTALWLLLWSSTGPCTLMSEYA